MAAFKIKPARAYTKANKKTLLYRVAAIAVTALSAVAWACLKTSSAACYETCFDKLLGLLGLDLVFFALLTVLLSYLLLGLAMFFCWGRLGTRGLFYLVQLHITAGLLLIVVALYVNIKYHLALSAVIGELFLTDDLAIYCAIKLDMLALIGALLVLFLTAVAITFGVEYMSREAFDYSVLTILTAFSASIVWFILSYDLGLMSIFWELSGIFSLLLVDTFYTRVRTTQAVSRTYAIGRFSDYWLFLALAEAAALFDTESLAVIFSAARAYSLETITAAATVYGSNALVFLGACLFIAASAKCAQLVQYVWLPDAMEAPTPASALIHSSTLVVMGIFMIMRVAPILVHSGLVLVAALVIGAATVLYGAVESTRTGDLKKAVAYSTVSQVGYLYCGCGLLAFKETLVYLLVHAICKALLFVLVGYTVHMFQGMTTMRKMGGVFSEAPDLAALVTILCVTLAGCPYTVGFVAKELIVNHVFAVNGAVACFVAFCWIAAFLLTPIYLLRVCAVAYFGRPKSTMRLKFGTTRRRYHNKFMSLGYFNLDVLNSPLAFYIAQTRDLVFLSRFTSIVHVLLVVVVLFAGEFVVLLAGGFFNTSSLLFNGVSQDISTYAVTSLHVNTYSVARNVQAAAVSLFVTVVVYIVFASVYGSKSSWTIANAVLFAVLLYMVWVLSYKLYLYSVLC